MCQKLIEGMPRRISAVVKARGGHTKYQNIIISACIMRAKIM